MPSFPERKKMQKLNKYLILLTIGLIPILTFGTHNRGGEITYTHISGFTYEFTITTCTDVGDDAQANRDELFIDMVMERETLSQE